MYHNDADSCGKLCNTVKVDLNGAHTSHSSDILIDYVRVTPSINVLNCIPASFFIPTVASILTHHHCVLTLMFSTHHEGPYQNSVTELPLLSMHERHMLGA